MEIVIIEDEYHAAERLKKLILKARPQANIVAVLDSVEESVSWLNSNNSPNLIFMDIQLADGISFSIFEQCKLETPVIFTTAFDEYSLRAFKVNSIDYLMKPIDETELANAVHKFDKMQNSSQSSFEQLNSVLQNYGTENCFKERFLIKKKDSFQIIMSDQIAYFYSEDSVSFIIDKDGKNYIYDSSLSEIEKLVNPEIFYRINRKQIISIHSISGIHNYFNNRIKLDLTPRNEGEFVVSREKVKAFKDWLDK